MQFLPIKTRKMLPPKDDIYDVLKFGMARNIFDNLTDGKDIDKFIDIFGNSKNKT